MRMLISGTVLSISIYAMALPYTYSWKVRERAYLSIWALTRAHLVCQYLVTQQTEVFSRFLFDRNPFVLYMFYCAKSVWKLQVMNLAIFFLSTHVILLIKQLVMSHPQNSWVSPCVSFLSFPFLSCESFMLRSFIPVNSDRTWTQIF